MIKYILYLCLFKLTLGNKFIRFDEWVSKYDILYGDNVLYNWLDNDKYIETINAKNLTYKLGHNEWSGYSSDEFIELMNRLKSRKYHKNYNTLTDILLPETIDWRDMGMVTSIKNQGQCGSCWAFSTVQSIESAMAIKYGSLYNLSVQQLVDCDNILNNGYDHGCEGGSMDIAFSWTIKNKGLCLDTEYPYVSGTTTKRETCQKCDNYYNSNIINYIDILPNSDNAMMTALSFQPVSVAIEADQRDFQLYSSGVFTGKCGTKLDHGVGLVGYGTQDGLDYYILKNSWGTSWGINGYMYIGRGNDPLTGQAYNNGAGQCGVLQQGSYPVL